MASTVRKYLFYISITSYSLRLGTPETFKLHIQQIISAASLKVSEVDRSFACASASSMQTFEQPAPIIISSAYESVAYDLEKGKLKVCIAIVDEALLFIDMECEKVLQEQQIQPPFETNLSLASFRAKRDTFKAKLKSHTLARA